MEVQWFSWRSAMAHGHNTNTNKLTKAFHVCHTDPLHVSKQQICMPLMRQTETSISGVDMETDFEHNSEHHHTWECC